MADDIFENPRLAAVYDPLDPDRSDLAVYLGIAQRVRARSVLDIGCGTGTLAFLLTGQGFSVVGLDPAAASLDIARGKPGAERVRWIHGTARDLPPLQVDLVTMTANVAQAIVDRDSWAATLGGSFASLRPGGHLVFETRDPAARGWERWTRELTYTSVEVDGIGPVDSWTQVTAVQLPLISFKSWTRFHADGAVLESTSTLRFRERKEVEDDLAAAGFDLVEVTDAPDRPGLEFVFLAQRPAADNSARLARQATAASASGSVNAPA